MPVMERLGNETSERIDRDGFQMLLTGRLVLVLVVSLGPGPFTGIMACQWSDSDSEFESYTSHGTGY